MDNELYQNLPQTQTEKPEAEVCRMRLFGSSRIVAFQTIFTQSEWIHRKKTK